MNDEQNILPPQSQTSVCKMIMVIGCAAFVALNSVNGQLDELLARIRETQNKLLYAVTRQTAAELIVARADAQKPNMGLTTWKGNIVRKGDVIIVKNYLQNDEKPINRDGNHQNYQKEI